MINGYTTARCTTSIKAPGADGGGESRSRQCMAEANLPGQGLMLLLALCCISPLRCHPSALDPASSFLFHFLSSTSCAVVSIERRAFCPHVAHALLFLDASQRDRATVIPRPPT